MFQETLWVSSTRNQDQEVVPRRANKGSSAQTLGLLFRLRSLLGGKLAVRLRRSPQTVTTGTLLRLEIYRLLLAESRLTGRLFGGMLGNVATLPSPIGKCAERGEFVNLEEGEKTGL
jgi:hypothetical protein